MKRNRAALLAYLVLAPCVLRAAAAPPPELKDLNSGYRREIIALARDKMKTPIDRSRAIVTAARAYARKLTDLQKVFLKKGDLKSATAVKNELDRAMADKLLLAALSITNKARKEHANAPPPVEPAIDRDLVLHYSFENDPKGFAADSSPLKNHGQLVGPVTHKETRRGRVVRLGGPGTYIACGAKSLNTDKWPAITLSAWVHMKKHTGFGVVMARGEISGKTTGGFHMQVGGRSPTGWRAGRFSTAGSDLEPTTFKGGVDPMPKLNRWYHLVGTYDGKEIRFYVDGALDSATPATTKGAPLSDSPSTKLVIGNHAAQPYMGWADMYFDGWLDDIRIWKRALTPAEVKQLHAAEARHQSKQGTGQARRSP